MRALGRDRTDAVVDLDAFRAVHFPRQGCGRPGIDVPGRGDELLDGERGRLGELLHDPAAERCDPQDYEEDRPEKVPRDPCTGHKRTLLK